MKKNLPTIIAAYVFTFLKTISKSYILLSVPFLLLPLIVVSSNSISENLFVELNCENNICKCKSKENFNIDTVLQAIKNYSTENSSLLACAYHQLAVTYFNNENYDYEKAIFYNKNAMKLRELNNDGWLWKSHLNLALCYYSMDNYSRALHYLEKAKDQEGNPKRSVDSIRIFNYLSQSYKEIGEFEKAIQFAKKSVSVNANISQVRGSLVTYSEILIATKDSLNIKKAISCLDSLENTFSNNEDSVSLYTVRNNLGNAYYFSKQFDKAIEKNNQAFELLPYLNYKAPMLNNIGVNLIEQSKFDESYQNLRKSLKLKKEYFNSEYNYEYAVNYENLGDYYLKLEKKDSGLLHYQKALINLTNNFRNENIYQNPNPKDTTLFIYSNPDMIRVLHLKATAVYQYYHLNKNIKYLNLAKQTYQTLIDFHNKLQQDISTENSRLFQAKNILEYLENALEVAYEKQTLNDFDAEATFRFMEKNKATVLQQAMNEADALQFANLSDSLLEQENDLKITISFYERKLNDAKINEDTLTVINDLENTLFENKENYERLINHLEENYPNYYRLKYQQNKSTLAEVQSQLNEKQALLEYFVGFKHIYVLSIQQNNSKLYQIEKPKDWEKRINDFVGIFKKPKFDIDLQTQVKNYVEQANFLYKILLQQPLNDLNESITHLQVISDAELNYIPFDVLFYETIDTTNELTFRDLPYLLKSKAIAYAYSAKLWLDNVNSKPLNKPIAYGGYASQHQLKEANIDLPIARKQVQSMAELFKGKPYIANEATKSAFLKDTLAYNILQFAMHGEVNDTLPLNSHLVFTQTDSLNKLYAADLYNIKLQTDLAVLGACNTGTGKVQKGEGVMSLSRAFTYAGCPSLVMSLWSIPDVSSAKVLEAFFKNLKEGYPKDVALQKAKLNFLETSEKTHPRNWAGLVAVGNLEALDLKSDTPASAIVALGVVGVLGVLILLISGFMGKRFVAHNK